MLHNCATGVQQRKNLYGDAERKDDIANRNFLNESRRMQRLYTANSSTDSRILFPVTFRTAAAYLIAKVRLYDTFNISFKVRVQCALLLGLYIAGLLGRPTLVEDFVFCC